MSNLSKNFEFSANFWTNLCKNLKIFAILSCKNLKVFKFLRFKKIPKKLTSLQNCLQSEKSWFQILKKITENFNFWNWNLNFWNLLFRLGTGTGTFGTFYFDWELELELLELFNPNQELELERNFLGRFGTGTGTGTFIFFGTLGTLSATRSCISPKKVLRLF